MPKQQSQSDIFAKIKAKAQQAFNAHKGDETVVSGGGELPAGIENGIAQLTDIKFDTYKKGDMVGQPFFMARAAVKQPEYHDKTPIKGLFTQIGPEPICETPGRTRQSIEDHMAWVLNEVRKLGAKTEDLEFDDLESVLEALRQAQPHIRFRTWKGAKATEGKYKDVEPRTNHQWGGVVSYEEGVEAGDGLEQDVGPVDADAPPPTTPDTFPDDDSAEDETPAPPPVKKPSKAQAPTAPSKPVAPKKSSKAAPPPVEEEEDEEAVGAVPDADLDNLAKLAQDDDDEEAQNILKEAAVAVGIVEERVDAANTWKAVIKMIRAARAAIEKRAAEAQQADESLVGDDDEDADEASDTNDDDNTGEDAESEENEADEIEVSVGEVYYYKGVDPKTGKLVKRGSEVEVLAVNAVKKTATLKDMTTGRPMVDPTTKKPLQVSWDKLDEQP